VTRAPDPEAGTRATGPASGLVGENLVKRFGDRVVVDDVDIHLAAGEVLALVGGNGTGKTTLLRLLSGVLDPDEGTLTWQGRTLDESDPWVRREVAVLLDDAGAFPDLAVAEHLELLARAFGLDDPTGRAAATVTDVGLDGHGHQLPATLSSGQRHRLDLASVLVRPAGLLVLDEPEQRLDEEGRLWLGARLRALADAGAAVVLASHDEALVRTVADFVLDLEG
jgi:ABC-2 type transport system ATP-binding protein